MSAHPTSEQVIERLGFSADIERLNRQLAEWMSGADREMSDALSWQFRAGSKYFRPLTIFSCYQALYDGPTPAGLIRTAAGLEMLHNVSLIIDDIVDGSTQRRGISTLHHKFGMLHALMVSGYIVADAYRMVEHDAYDAGLFSELLKRLGVAECYQWRTRRAPGGAEDWWRIAQEDTGSMFEVCACLGTRTGELRLFGQLLGVLYHGCDDVGDVRGSDALGGGGAQDLRDAILTLPAALSLGDEGVAAVFRQDTRSDDDVMYLASAFKARLPDSEAYLDVVAGRAREEARRVAPNPQPLLELVGETRLLSSR